MSPIPFPPIASPRCKAQIPMKWQKRQRAALRASRRRKAQSFLELVLICAWLCYIFAAVVLLLQMF